MERIDTFKEKKAWKYFLLIGMGILLSIYISVITILFLQLLADPDGDIIAHIHFAERDKGYSVLYELMEFLINLTGSYEIIVVLEVLLVIMGWGLSVYWIYRTCEKRNLLMATAGSIPLLFLSSIYVPKLFEFFYKRSIITQPWHNITYLAVRVFSVLVILAFASIIKDGYEKSYSMWKILLLTVLLMICTSIKPNFYLGFAFTLFLFLCKDLLKYKFGSEFRQIFVLGCTVLPSLLILVWQVGILFGKSAGEGGSSIVLLWGSRFVKHGFLNVIMKFLTALPFPMLVYIYNKEKLCTLDKFIAVNYVVQLVVVIMFGEIGRRANDGNFYWGLINAAYLLFMISIGIFIKGWNSSPKNTRSRMYKIFGILLLLLHTISGIFYLKSCLLGKVFV